MNKYLTIFGSHSQYVEPLVKPNVSYCIQEDEVHYNPNGWQYEYLTFVANENSTFTFVPQNNNVISYSIDGGETWTNGNSVTVNSGDKVMWKGEMTPYSTVTGIGHFSSTGKVEVQGNVMSLLYGDNFKGQTDLTGKDGAFANLFGVTTKIINAENVSLPATILSEYCYRDMFSNCVMITKAPKLPATVLAEYCYTNMFDSCTRLTVAPKLPATTLVKKCYSGMFYKCINLITAPELPATTLAEQCYGAMFAECASLTTAPELPATTLASKCYSGMLRDCTNLTTAPELPAITLVDNCYQYMFSNCTKLNYIKAMFTTTPSNTYTENWVNGVASTGTFVKNSAAQWNVTGANGIPTNWTVQTATE